MFEKKVDKRGQVWVETVIYTLIAITMIGLVWMFAQPKIESIKSQMAIEQTIDSMGKINDQIYDVQIAPGNTRILDVTINKGKLIINPEQNSLEWVLESKYKYSEIDRIVRLGSLSVLTSEGKPYSVKIFSNYSVDLTLNGGAESFEYEASPTPYKVVITNNGARENILNINIQVN